MQMGLQRKKLGCDITLDWSHHELLICSMWKFEGVAIGVCLAGFFFHNELCIMTPSNTAIMKAVPSVLSLLDKCIAVFSLNFVQTY